MQPVVISLWGSETKTNELRPHLHGSGGRNFYISNPFARNNAKSVTDCSTVCRWWKLARFRRSRVNERRSRFCPFKNLSTESFLAVAGFVCHLELATKLLYPNSRILLTAWVIEARSQTVATSRAHEFLYKPPAERAFSSKIWAVSKPLMMVMSRRRDVHFFKEVTCFFFCSDLIAPSTPSEQLEQPGYQRSSSGREWVVQHIWKW